MTGLRGMSAAAALLTLGIFALASAAAAQSAYGCRSLDGRHAASIEGKGGVFFPLSPDLEMFHPLADESIADLAELSAALRRNGTELVIARMPTRAMVLTEALPARAYDYGFDPEIAATLYDGVIAGMSRAGIRAPNLRRALRLATRDTPAFFATDLRMTPAGARAVAREIATTIAAIPGVSAFARETFVSRPGPRAKIQSAFRTRLQRHCRAPLPEPEMRSWSTFRATPASAAGAEEKPRGMIALVGADNVALEEINLGGFLAEATGLEVAQYGVAGGGAFAAISAYLTSDVFAAQRPTILVWVLPAEANLASRGDQPMTELVAAARADCTGPLPATPDEHGRLMARLDGVEVGQGLAIALHSGRAPVREARFAFTSARGERRTRWVARHPDQVATRRAFVPLSALWPEGAAAVTISADVPLREDARISVCRAGGGEGR